VIDAPSAAPRATRAQFNYVASRQATHAEAEPHDIIGTWPRVRLLRMNARFVARVERAFVQELNGGTPGDAKAGLRVFKGRPQTNLVQSYGPEFADALAAAQPGVWQALRTREGWRAVRVNAISPPKPAAFESLRGVVLQDWTDAQASEQRSAAVRALTKKYKIKYETAR